jgi:hypothetical protein
MSRAWIAPSIFGLEGAPFPFDLLRYELQEQERHHE